MGEVLDRIRARCGYPAGRGPLATEQELRAAVEQEAADTAETLRKSRVREAINASFNARTAQDVERERRTKLREQFHEAEKEIHLRREIREQRARRDPEDAVRFVKYDLDPQDYQRMIAQQNGVCAICREPGRKLVVDHDHRSGRVRSLLCGHCNSAIGFLRESPLLARAAATYLELQLVKELT